VNNLCSHGFGCINLQGSYTCLPSVSLLQPVVPNVLANMSGGDIVQFRLSFQTSRLFSSLSSLVDEKYMMAVFYGPASAPSTFSVNSLSLNLISGSSTTYDGSFESTPGYGTNLAVQIQWTLASTWTPGAFFDRSGYITTTDTFRYPSPTLTSLSLRLNSSSDTLISEDGEFAYVNAPPTGSSNWVTFSGFNFGLFPQQVSIFYASLAGTRFPCVTTPDPTVVNGPTGSVLLSSIICRTATNEPAAEYFFFVEVAGQTSVPGVDKLIFPTVPMITAVSGCEPCPDEVTITCNCPTSGGIRITITGDNFGLNMEVEIASLSCLSPSLIRFDQLSCLLPAGTGASVSVTVLIRISMDEVLRSAAVYKIGYAPPVVTGVFHSNCVGQSGSALALVDCPRAGGGTLTITGQNLGINGAVVLVGSGLCGNLLHVLASTQVQCTLPPGIATYLGVIFIQSGGRLSLDDATVSYVQCTAGTYQRGAEQTCQRCDAGSITATSGQYSCSQCSSGTKSNTNLDSCIDCLVGQWSDAGATVCSDCMPGSFASAPRSIACLDCPAGSFQSLSAASSCTNCQYGKFQQSVGRSFCELCSEGSYTSSSTTLLSCALCSAGRFQNAREATFCVDCQAGRHQNITGLSFCESCEAGKYSATTATVNCLSCDAGRFQGADGRTGCDSCPSGKSQLSFGTTMCSDCDVGSYSASPASLVCVTCEAGRSQPLAGQTLCDNCAYGKYKGISSTAVCSDCATGKYTSAATTLFVCADCEPGKYQPTVGSTGCSLCDVGTYQNITGQSSCDGCAAGRFAGGAGMPVCLVCEAGKMQALFSQSVCVNCEYGKFKQFASNAFCEVCPLGTYTDADTTLFSCADCPAGTYYQNVVGTTCELCPVGKYNSEFAQTICSECETGRFTATLASLGCLDCAAGSYQELIGQSVCEACQFGKSKGSASTEMCSDCPAGKYTSPGTTLFVCADCEVGKIQPSPSSMDCILCIEGTYQSSPGQTVCQLCDRGKYAAITGVSACVFCDVGTFQNLSGQSNCPSCPRNAQNQFIDGTPEFKSCECSPSFYSVPFGNWLDFQSLDSSAYDVYREVYVISNTAPVFDANEYLGFWCATCPQGADCRSSGVTMNNVQALPDYFIGKCLSR
jgi:hypothetical protein